jgi:hypothetical protein
MFLCLSFLGLISLLSFSAFSQLICKQATSERLVGVGVAEDWNVYFQNHRGPHLKKHPAYLNVFVCMILN